MKWVSFVEHHFCSHVTSIHYLRIFHIFLFIPFCVCEFWELTDFLAEFDELHLGGHVAHGPHALSQILTADEAVPVFVKLFEGLTQLCKVEIKVISNLTQRYI